MSTAKGGVHSRAQKHQNTFAFKHNKNSKKTASILKIAHSGLCRRCHEQIEWRKKYRKYKPLKAPRKCRGCENRTVTLAYHILCPSCAGGRNVCAKCNTVRGAENEESIETDRSNKVATVAEIEEFLGEGVREREKRSILRKIERGELLMSKTTEGNIELREVEVDVEAPSAFSEDEDMDDSDAS